MPSKSRPQPELEKPAGAEPASALAAAPQAGQESQHWARWAAQAGLNKKAHEVEIIEVLGKVDYADYLVVMTGQSRRHVAALARSVAQHLHQHGVHAVSTEGLPEAEWVLIDLVDVVVHIFQQQARSTYDLDGLWLDAKRLAVPCSTEA